MALKKSFVSMAVDLSRLPDDPIAEAALPAILNVGREVDLLETVRRTEKNAVVPVDILKVQASRLRIPGVLFKSVTIVQFQEKHMLSFVDSEKVQLDFQNSSEVYDYGLKRISETKEIEQLKLLEILSETLVRPATINDFYDVLGMFPKHFRDGLWNFIVKNKVLITFQWKNEGFLINHRLYKDKKKFEMALEILEEQKLGDIVEFLQNNPGNPLPVVSQCLGTPTNNLYLLSKYGILEPLRLDVQGDAKEYLFSPSSTLMREDKDHFDLVKMTLANFRFGEYYSKKTRLWSLDKFFTKLLGQGYAGSAEAIGTDYENLEKNGIVRVQKLHSSKYRFWVLKRDVIEDAHNIVRGVIPIKSTKTVVNLIDINNLVTTRRQIDVEIAQASQRKVLKALRDIQEGACS